MGVDGVAGEGGGWGGREAERDSLLDLRMSARIVMVLPMPCGRGLGFGVWGLGLGFRVWYVGCGV